LFYKKILKKIAKSKRVNIKSIITKFLFVKARLKMLIFFIRWKIFLSVNFISSASTVFFGNNFLKAVFKWVDEKIS
jgi:hypothetical protein